MVRASPPQNDRRIPPLSTNLSDMTCLWTQAGAHSLRSTQLKFARYAMRL